MGTQRKVDELVSIGQGNHKDNGSQRNASGEQEARCLYLSGDVLDPYCLFHLAHGIWLKQIAMDNEMMM